MNSVLLHAGETIYPDEFKVPKVPYNWVEPSTNTEKRWPTFDKMENQGGWSIFS